MNEQPANDFDDLPFDLDSNAKAFEYDHIKPLEEEGIDEIYSRDEPNLLDECEFEDSAWQALPLGLQIRSTDNFEYFVYPGKYPIWPRKNFSDIEALEAWLYTPKNHDKLSQYILISKFSCPGQDSSNWMRLRLRNVSDKLIEMIKLGESRRKISAFTNIVKLVWQEDDSGYFNEYWKWKVNELIQHDLDLTAQEILNMKLWMQLNYEADFNNPVTSQSLPPYHLRRHLREGCKLEHPLFVNDRWTGKAGKFVEWISDIRSSFYEISHRGDIVKVCEVHEVKISPSQISAIIKGKSEGKSEKRPIK